tara:strand:+ start:19690 stop:20667 length:978 start_codon:yes stop_codon:yes gene_type:complete
MSSIQDLPVLILAHSRADKFVKCISRIYEYGIRKIYLSLDGPRNKIDSSQQKLMLEECEKYKNQCSLKINMLDKNYGCRDGHIFALDWFFDKEDYGIILEDDLYLSKNCILTFSDLLKKYDGSKNIMSLSSYNEFVREEPRRLVISPVWRGWGWATWAEKWKIHKEFIVKARKQSMYKLIKYLPESLRTPKNIQTIKAVHLNYLKAYDYEFNFTHLALQYSSLTISGINMNNVGFDKYATHCFDKDNFPYLEKFKDHEVDINLIDNMDNSQTKATLQVVGFDYKNNGIISKEIFQKLIIFSYAFIFLLRKIKRLFINKSGFNIFK